MTDLKGLIERVKAATGPDRSIDEALWLAFDPGAAEAHAKGMVPLPWLCLYTASIDAIVALIERKLPGWDYGLDKGCKDNTFWCYLYPAPPPNTHLASSAPTAPLALCLAFLTALQSLDTGGGGA